MISAKNIYKNFGDLEVLKGVSLDVSESEIVSIVGASGAGKTTLLQILSSLEKSTEPEKHYTQILIKKQDITKLSDANLSKFRNENIGFIFQFHQLLPEFTAFENVCIPAYIGNGKKNKIHEKAKELLNFLNLGNRLEQDRKSTRLNSSHVAMSYAVFCLKKKNEMSPSYYALQ